MTPRSLIVADERTGATSKPGLNRPAQADLSHSSVNLAMGAGKKAAQAIDEYLQKQ